MFLLVEQPCFSAYLGQNYSSKEGKWKPMRGVNISIPDWGKTYSVDTLDPAPLAKYAIPYFHKMIETLKKRGYTDGVNMAGGGFHWYEPPSKDWVLALMQVVENMVSNSGGVPAVLVAHSMGAPLVCYSWLLVHSVYVCMYGDVFVCCL